MNKPVVNIINKINVNKWIKQYKSNNFVYVEPDKFNW